MWVNGHNLNVVRQGSESGPAVVLLHHGLGSLRAWKEQVPVLLQSGYQVIAYDRWGYGNSDPRPALDLPTFSADVQDLYNILEQLAISEAALVGHSDGGTLALYFAAQYPGRVRCLVTIAAHIYLELNMEPGFLGIKHTMLHDERFRIGLQHAHGDQYERVFSNWFDGWHRKEYLTWDMRPSLSHIRCPVLVVQGEKDEYATPQHAKDIAAEIAGSELWLVPEAGHMLPQENCDLFNPKLLQFLKAHHA